NPAPAQIKTWNLDFSRERRSLTGLGQIATAFSSDSRTFAGLDGVGVLRIWDTAAYRKLGESDRRGKRAIMLFFCEGDKEICTAGPDGVQYWDAATGKHLRSLENRGQIFWQATTANREFVVGFRSERDRRDFVIWNRVTDKSIEITPEGQLCEGFD